MKTKVTRIGEEARNRKENPVRNKYDEEQLENNENQRLRCNEQLYYGINNIIFYGGKRWSISVKYEQQMSAAEMKSPRKIVGVTRGDVLRN